MTVTHFANHPPVAAYILYTHMMAQRRKVMKAAKAQGQKAQ